MREFLLKLAESGALPILIAVLGFIFFMSLIIVFNPAKKIAGVYEKVSKGLVEKKKVAFWDYDDIKKRLLKNGMTFHIPQLQDPIVYMGVRIVLGLLLGVLLLQFHVLTGFMGFLLGFNILDILFFFQNRMDNEAMVDDLQFLYNTISIQIKGGVYIMDAMCRNYDQIQNLRLKKAMAELAGEVLMNTDSRTAIEEFQSKFDNEYIDSLCIAVQQALDSGKSLDLFEDISEQIKVLQEIIYKKKLAQLDRSMTVVTLILFATAIGFVLYLLVSSLFVAVSGM